MSNKIEHTSAGGVNFEPNKKLGYYVVNNEIYYNKNQAMLAGSKQPGNVGGLNNDPVRWMFNEDAFIKFPWHEEPTVPLNELYRIRAQQLRDRYDYIRLELSGGADSTTVAYAFLLNGIPLDEVVFRYPEKGSKDATNNPWDTQSRNHLSEWEFAAKGGCMSKGYKYSGSDTIFKVAWVQSVYKYKTHKVGTKRPNELGIYDMCGNVSEWCNDWYCEYKSYYQKNPKGCDVGVKKVRRGIYCENVADYLLFYRSGIEKNYSNCFTGFRVAREIKKTDNK